MNPCIFMRTFPWFIRCTPICGLVLAGCSSMGLGALTEQMHTRIIDNGRKFFEFSLTLQKPITVYDIHDSRDLYRLDDSLRRRISALLTERMQIRLKATGYCRAGFFELERYLDGQKATVHGECVDTATTDDRIKFKNNKT